MELTDLNTLGLGALALVVFLSGFWLSRSGKPYASALVNVHKLTDLVAILLLGRAVVEASRTAAQTALQLGLAGLGGILILALLISGGLLSTNKPMPPWLPWLHRVAPFLLLGTAAAMLILMMASGA